MCTLQIRTSYASVTYKDSAQLSTGDSQWLPYSVSWLSNIVRQLHKVINAQESKNRNTVITSQSVIITFTHFTGTICLQLYTRTISHVFLPGKSSHAKLHTSSLFTKFLNTCALCAYDLSECVINSQKQTKQVVKVIWHKAASPPHMDSSVVFFRWRQCAPHI